MSDSLQDFSDLIEELRRLIKEWTALSPSERAEKQEQFSNWHKDIAAKMVALSKPKGTP